MTTFIDLICTMYLYYYMVFGQCTTLKGGKVRLSFALKEWYLPKEY